eukprot:TRINITY_DN949_c0_g1_i2.p2 TRINITY_DN949_c0_g1~~TRINITY_DN949_c0_g1_i2.p2  ORF type:complete len:157 (+),score=48.53 TRINITY_DN949_c0_g1_i2:90-560(+)
METKSEHNLSEKQLEELKQSFRLFDKNGDGKITHSELRDAMKKLGVDLSKKEVTELIKSVDKNKNGTVEFDEFVELMKDSFGEPSAEDEENKLREAFKVFDRNGDGSISKDELVQVMKNLGRKLTKQEAEDMLKSADTDGNGQIDYEEFIRLMKAL